MLKEQPLAQLQFFFVHDSTSRRKALYTVNMKKKKLLI